MASSRRARSGSARLVLLLALFFAAASFAGWFALRGGARRRVLVIGWDGATYAMIDPMLAAGRLPVLAKLLERGSSARLESTKVPISSAAWVGAVTGKTPGENGVYSFFEPIEGSYDVKLISSRSNQATPMWRILGWHGLRSIVFGVPVTFPPEMVEGVMVGCMLSPFDADYAYPKVLTQQLRERGFVPDLGAWRERQNVTFERVKQQLAIKEQILAEMLREQDWSLAMIVFKDLDVWCHRAYDGELGGPVAPHYELLDAALGRLLENVGPDVDVIVMSDHGFHPYHASFFGHAWLIQSGFAKASDALVHAKLTDTENLAERRAVEHQALLEMLDLEHSAAFPVAAEANFGGLRLNVKGREPKGFVEPDEVEATLAALERALRDWRAPGREAPVVTRVHRMAQLYPGPFAARLPDLVYELDPEISARSEPARLPFLEHERIYPDHHLEGIWITAGPSFAHLAERGQVSIFDLAPTVLALLDLPVYSEMSGRVVTSTLARELAPRRIPEADDPAAKGGYRPGPADFDPEQMREVKSRLRETGYAQ
jgi:predicted AlkP superfamily phosphohydrolase/phosphomutase